MSKIIFSVPVTVHTECPKIYRKYVLQLLRYTANLYLCMIQYRFAVNFGTLSMNCLREAAKKNSYAKGQAIKRGRGMG